MAQRNLPTENKIMYLENRLVVARRWGSGVVGELGVNRYKLLPLEWRSNEILLCSTGNYRRHTSFASVEVSPELDDDIEITI